MKGSAIDMVLSKPVKKLIFALLFLTAAIAVFPVYHAYADKPVFRIAYLESDPYINYAGSLSGLTYGLSQLGIVDNTSGWGFQEGSDDASVIWKWLKNHSGDKTEFVQDEFYQLIFMSDAEKKEFVRHMNEDDDVDLILVMGTAAAKFVRENNIRTDVMIMSVSSAYDAGIVDGIRYSGIDNVWAHTSPNRYYNQLNVFYDLFHFKKLGIVYEDKDTSKNEIAYNDIRRFTNKKGIDLIEKAVAVDPEDSPEISEKKMINAYHELAGKVDAVYMTNSGDRTPEKIPEYLAPLYRSGTPVFSQTGKSDVENGATMTIVRYNFQEIGSFCAKQFVQIMDGRRPGKLLQSYDESQSICFNLAAAERAGIKLPFKALLSADVIYTEIGDSKKNEK
jgi:ABC-type uncharacterized transport system substrate-binding protein